MSEIWKLMLKNLWPWTQRPATRDRGSTADLAAARQSASSVPVADDPQWYPHTFQTGLNDPGVERPQVFEPALKQFCRAFRNGEPVFQDPEQGIRWRAARRRTIDHLLEIVATSPWQDSLILRGSMLLKAWLGDAAREPGDIDWVISPATMKVGDSWARRMFDGLVKRISQDSQFDGVHIATDDVRMDEIWTYERSPGRRMVFPWHAAGLPAGEVQMDFAFGQELLVPAVRTSIPVCSGEPVVLWTATPQLSLAWKILWLETDMDPQGKDLYDATLLAEIVHLPIDLLQRTLAPAFRPDFMRLTPNFPMLWDVDWDNFRLEYPWVGGTGADWQQRLTTALKSTFAAAD